MSSQIVAIADSIEWSVRKPYCCELRMHSFIYCFKWLS